MPRDKATVQRLLWQAQTLRDGILFASADAYDHGVDHHPYEDQMPAVNREIEGLQRELRELNDEESWINWRELVRRRAHNLWQQRGAASGSSDGDWYRAEESLRNALTADIFRQIEGESERIDKDFRNLQ